jgi:predicted DNA-binding transcriptional regulator
MRVEGRFKGHIYHACLPADILFPTLKFQVDRELGKAFTSLQLHIAGLYHYGYIDKETFEKWTAKYSKSLTEKPVEPLTKADVEKQDKLQQIEKTLTNAYKEWNTLKPSAQVFHVKTAREHADLPIAQLILKEKAVS